MLVGKFQRRILLQRSGFRWENIVKNLRIIECVLIGLRLLRNGSSDIFLNTVRISGFRRREVNFLVS